MRVGEDDLIELISLELHLRVECFHLALVGDEIEEEQLVLVDADGDVLGHEGASGGNDVEVVLCEEGV